MSQSDSELLQCYAAQKAEPAFAELVRRHIDLVFSAALRQADGDRHLAEDVTQNVFVDLARKAAQLHAHPSLVGWLYTSTRFCARNARRSDHRRQIREQQAFAMNQLLQPDPGVNWDRLRPVLDDAMNSLNEGDRQAILLRFFNRLPLVEVGARLAVNENTARMRVERALEKLRNRLAKMGFTSTASVLAALLSSYAVEGAPMGLAATVTSAAVATGATATAVAGGLAAWLGLKGLLAGAAVVAVLAAVPVVRQLTRANPPALPALPAAQMVVQNSSPVAPPAAKMLPAASEEPAARAATAPLSGPMLTLHILKKNNDEPLAGVQIDYRSRSGGTLDHHTVSVGADGVVQIFYPAATTNLILTTEKDGFADTRLTWAPTRGEPIPQTYTVRPDPAVPISGRVVGAQGLPIAGASVKWLSRRIDDAGGSLSVESHTVEGVSLTTDAGGFWHTERIADDLLPQLEGDITNANYAPAFVTSQTDPAMAQKLRDGSMVITLNSTLTVTGKVVDATGRPVSGATVLVGRLLQPSHRETTTLADGSFTAVGCAPGPSPVTAQADGFAPAGVLITIAGNTAPVQLAMQPVHPLLLRVVSTDGAPVAGANVIYNWSDYDMPLAAQARAHPDRAVAQLKFREKTGPDGRLTWTNAPSGEVVFMVNAPGFTQTREASARADDVEHLITLTPGTLVTGTVRDAAGGAVIPNFRITLGAPEREPFFGRTNVQWINNRVEDFSDGTYRQALTTPLIIGLPNSEYVMKFEAEGYDSYVSRIFKEGEGEVRLDVSLRQSPAVIITVLKPDGQPAAGADVGLVGPGAGLRLRQGSFDHNSLTPALQQTAVDGRFRLPGDSSLTQIIFASNDGYLSATPASLRASGTAQLEPWGTIEGICLADGKPVAGRQYKLALPEESLDEVMCAFEVFKVETDARGRFTIQHAPPGNNFLQRVTTGVGPDGPFSSWGAQGQTPITVRPGETNTITLQF